MFEAAAPGGRALAAPVAGGGRWPIPESMVAGAGDCGTHPARAKMYRTFWRLNFVIKSVRFGYIFGYPKTIHRLQKTGPAPLPEGGAKLHTDYMFFIPGALRGSKNYTQTTIWVPLSDKAIHRLHFGYLFGIRGPEKGPKQHPDYNKTINTIKT